MNRFDGTAARQLALIDLDTPLPEQRRAPERSARARPNFKLLKQDVYAELARRRRRAQIAARHALEDQ